MSQKKKSSAKSSKKKKKSAKLPSWSSIVPKIRDENPSVIAYADRLGLADVMKDYTCDQNGYAHFGEIHLDSFVLKRRNWQSESSYLRFMRLILNLNLLMKHMPSVNGQSILVWGPEALLYAGAAAKRFPQSPIYVLDTSSSAIPFERLVSREKSFRKITMISEGECDLMQFDCVLGVNLFNEWLYDRKVQDFLPVLDRVRSYIKEIKPRLQWLGKRVSKGGCYVNLQEDAGSMAYLTFRRYQLEYFELGQGSLLYQTSDKDQKMDPWCKKFTVLDVSLKIDEQSVIPEKSPEIGSLNVYDRIFISHMTQFRNELIDAKNNSKIESETPANEGTINRFIVETYWEAIRTVELDVLLKSGKQTKIRSSLSFWQEEEGSEPYYCVSFWEIPQDSYTVLTYKINIEDPENPTARRRLTDLHRDAIYDHFEDAVILNSKTLRRKKLG